MAASISPTRRRTTNVRTAAVRKPAPVRTYRQVLAYLDGLVNYEKSGRMRRKDLDSALPRMNRLLAALGNPHKRLRIAHIAGTKGKGSTAAMLAHMIQANRLSVGLYSSPHLLDVRERITVNGRMISETDFARVVARVADAAESLRGFSPTFFEVLTAAAFSHFAAKKVDVAVLETGLGGRYDCTNVVAKPLVCGITSISLDHMDQLGSTLAQIAEEKAGIFKPGVPVVSAPQPAEVKRVLRKAAERVKAPLMFAGDDIEFSFRFESSRATGPHTRVSVATPHSRFEHLAVPLPGEHQAINCGLALGMLDVLKAGGMKLNDEASITGLSTVHLAGRMELLCDAPRVLVDGAHNAASIEALMRAIGQNISYDSMVLIFGCNADKDIPGMLRHIQLGADKIIFTRSDSARAAEPNELAARFAELSGRMSQVAPRLADALAIAVKAVSREDLIVIAGSFYLVGEAKRLFSRAAFVQQLIR